MVVNDVPGEECRIAIIQDGHLEELYSERTDSATNVGNIYKGRVNNVEPAIQAAFIDYGEAQNGFLHISDLHPRYFPGKERTERVGKKIPRRERPLIQDALKRGDEVLVQVLKEGIGTKGPTLTSYLSIPGRLLVAMPDMDRVGVSRKVEDEDKRREMRKILDSLDLPENFGFILRTAGFGQPKSELKRDAAYLMRLWKTMEKRIQTIKAPCELYAESDVLIRTIRDVVRPTIQAVVVDSESAFDRASAFLRVVAPRSAPKLLRYSGKVPIFHAFDIERQIDLIHSRVIPLPSGGALVIDQTEALVAIDVNSGRSRSARDSETNAYQTNCEAVDEICRQLRLRDLGGLIVNDLIDMRMHKHRRLIEDRFVQNLKRDRARTTVLRISEFGLLEMTRQRMRPSMRKTHFMPCPHCHGQGEIKSPDSVGADAVRQMGYLLQFDRVRRLEVVCSPRVASVLLSNKRRELVRLEDAAAKGIDVRVSDAIAVDRVDFYAYDDRNADIDITKLPRPNAPTLVELEAAQESANEQGAVTEVPVEGGVVQAVPSDDKVSRKKRRRRRRRGDGAPDAPPPASAERLVAEVEAAPAQPQQQSEAAEEAEPVETARPTRPARRDRSRTRDTAAQRPQQVSQPVEVAAPQPPATPMRVHALAKELGITSRQLLDYCKSAPDLSIELKSHMSTVPADAVAVLRNHFAPKPAVSENGAAVTDHDVAAGDEHHDEHHAAKRRRRRRGGKKHKARLAAKAAAEQHAQHSDDPAPNSEDAESAPAQDNGQLPSVTKTPKPVSSKKKPRRQSRAREQDKPASASGKDAQTPTPESAVPEKTAARERPQTSKAADAAKASTSETETRASQPVESQPPAKPKRRPLYRNRSRVSTAARQAAERVTDA